LDLDYIIAVDRPRDQVVKFRGDRPRELGDLWLSHSGRLKERLVICNEEDTDGRATVTEERVLLVD